VRNLLLYCLIGAIGVVYSSCSCQKSPTASSGAEYGAVEAMINVGPVGSLEKAANIQLREGYLQLATAGETTRLDSFSLSSNVQVQVSKTYSDLRVTTTPWNIKAWSVDVNGKVIHSDSTTCTIIENDTVKVTLNLPAKYSQLPVRVFPVSDSMTEVKITVNGVKVADSVFAKNSGFDTLKMSYDYLQASPSGILNTILIQAYGDWITQDTLLWSGQDTVTVISGANISRLIQMLWVGPKIGGVNVAIIYGAVGTVSVDGIVNPRPKPTQP
jgi:hypothetical protein